MGVDLTGYFVIGPKHIDELQVQQAKLVAQETVNAARELMALARTKEMSGLGLLTVVALVDFNLWRINEDCAAYGEDELEELAEELATLTEADIGLAVDNFVEWWNADGGPYARDTCTRPLDKDSIIVFSGDATWGDPPDGVGHGFFDEIQRLNVWDAFRLH